MMPMTSSMDTLNSLNEHDQNEVQHDLFYQVVLALVMASTDTDGVIKGINALYLSIYHISKLVHVHV